MSTLLLRLEGPLQSWGLQSRFIVRDTGREPTKSGVIGLLCAALGRPRHEPVDDLAILKMGVRVDREGVMGREFQTASGVLKAGTDKILPNPVVSERYFLSDASFLVGLEGETALLEQLARAVMQPVWQLYLGRKSYVPSQPILPLEHPVDVPLDEALRKHPWTPPPNLSESEWPERLRMVIEQPYGSTNEVRPDQPYEASYETRRFMLRYVETVWMKREEVAPCTSHS